MSEPIYDTIGRGYAVRRRPDPRIGAAIQSALAGARTVVNVGAGAGSYEPDDREVVAVEPSATMIAQRPPGGARVVQAGAEDLPFPDGAFDAAMAVLTIHHWSDPDRGLAELRRVARDRIVILTFDPDHPGFWLTVDYFPDLRALDRQICPTLGRLVRGLGEAEVTPVPIPHDCRDGFLGAFWRRPHAYLDPTVRAAMSTFAKLTDVEPRVRRLARDLEDGTWHARHGHLLGETQLDLGYRLLTARAPS